jgi:hypothetical protein
MDTCQLLKFSERAQSIVNRRSKYIGVSKNGLHWQVLVNVGASKFYIGTFDNEKHAAIVYDFHAIALNPKGARVNFMYTNEIITDMIDNYLSNSKILDPTPFIHRVAYN